MPGKKRQRSTYMPDELLDRGRNAVFWCRNIPGEPQTFSELVNRGLLAEVERLELAHNEGQPFKEGAGLRPGPAPGVMEEVHRLRRQAASGARAEEVS